MSITTVKAPSAFGHGQQQCRECFGNSSLSWHSAEIAQFSVRGHRWQLRANPGYWGAAEPRILVLGFSKGPEQGELIEKYVNSGGKALRFEQIPFNDTKNQMRPNLKRLLVELGLIDKDKKIDELFEPTESQFGFASLIRCTVGYAKPNSDNFVGSGGGITEKTIALGPPFVGKCVQRHLPRIPASVELILMLGMTDGYVNSVRGLLQGTPMFDGQAYAYRYRDKPVVHIPHPAGGNNGAVRVFCGERPPSPKSPSEKNVPLCRSQARAVIQSLGHRLGLA